VASKLLSLLRPNEESCRHFRGHTSDTLGRNKCRKNK
jgi:hypothetical protein